MSNVKHRRKYETFDCTIWKRTHVDHQGRVTLPQKLRKKLGVNEHSSILWISVHGKNGKNNEFLIAFATREKFDTYISSTEGLIPQWEELSKTVKKFTLTGLIKKLKSDVYGVEQVEELVLTLLDRGEIFEISKDRYMVM